MNTRRTFLRAGLAGIMAPAFPPRGDKENVGTLYAHTTSMRVGGDVVRGILAIDPEQGSWKNVSSHQYTPSRISPDGKTIAFRKPQDSSLWLADVNDEREPRPLIEVEGRPFWSADGKTLIVSSSESGTWRVKADGSGKEKLPIADRDLVSAVSLGGDWYVVTADRDENNPNRPLKICYAIKADGMGRTLLTTNTEMTTCWQHRFTPDGQSIAYFQASDDDCSFWLIDRDGKNRRKFLPERDDEAPFNVCWSPDGSKMAIVLFDRSKGDDGKKNDLIRDCRIEIADLSGKNGKVLPLPKSTALFLLGWI